MGIKQNYLLTRRLYKLLPSTFVTENILRYNIYGDILFLLILSILLKTGLKFYLYDRYFLIIFYKLC